MSTAAVTHPLNPTHTEVGLISFPTLLRIVFYHVPLKPHKVVHALFHMSACCYSCFLPCDLLPSLMCEIRNSSTPASPGFSASMVTITGELAKKTESYMI